MVPYGIWEVSGRAIIPGTRKAEAFGPVKICEKDRQTASKELAKLLNQKFRRELRKENRFSDGYAMAYLNWRDLTTTAPTE
jgi:hypothetical protein